MADIYLYADESGDLDLSGSAGASAFFGFGTAAFEGPHGDRLWEGLRLCCALEARGVHLDRGFHAKNDSHATRGEVFSLLAAQAARLDATFLLKSDMPTDMRASGPVALYRTALLLHLTSVIPDLGGPADVVYVIVGALQTSRKRHAIRHAVEDTVLLLGKRHAACGMRARSFHASGMRRAVGGFKWPTMDCGPSSGISKDGHPSG